MAEGASSEEAPEKPSLISSMPRVTDHDRQLAAQAAEDFEKGHYDKCMTSLNKLAESRESDPRVQHNMAVVNYYSSRLKKTDLFQAALRQVCAKCHVNVDQLSGLDDVDQCVLYYNHGVILYYKRQYQTALAILDKLFQFIEPMEEGLSRKVLFLLVELYLCTQQPDKAMGMLTFIEKSVLGNGKSPSPDKEKEGKEEKSNKEKSEKGEKDKDTSADAELEKLRTKVSMLKARCYMMLKSLKSCKREIKSLTNSMGNTMPLSYVKSNFEFIRGNYRKAIKVLNSGPQGTRPSSETGECLVTMYYNNLGVIHFNMRKHNLATFYMRKAMQENQLACKELSASGRPLPSLSTSRYYELMSNLGIQLLHCGQPLAAFDCLIETVQVFRVNPRLWLRLAECCIMAHKANNDDDRKLERRLEVVVGSVGTGIHRKLILGTGNRNLPQKLDSSAIPSSCLEFASLCLRNAIVLLPQDPLDRPPPTAGDDQPEQRQTFDLVPAPPGNPMRESEVATLRCSILASSAYVSLCLNDHLVALQYAEKLLRQSKCSPALRYCGRLYMGEALVALDRIADGISYLNPDMISDINTSLPEVKPEPEKDKNGDKDVPEHTPPKGSLYPWQPRDVATARAIMQYNLSAAHAIRGEYEKALMTLTMSIQNIGMPLPAQVYFLKIYLELMQGHRKVAQGIIKEHFGHVTPNRVV